MRIFLDTANLDEIRKGAAYGIVDGVTTNPSLIAKEGVPIEEQVKRICEIVDGDISAEVVAIEAKAMISEGLKLAKIHKNIVVKLPLIRDGIIACSALSKEGIRTNVTLCFTPAQALLAAKAGAYIVSPFVGRLDGHGHTGMDLVRQIKTIYDQYGFRTQIIVAAVRHPTHVLESALAGAHIATMNIDILRQLYEHPLTDLVAQQFLNDWKKVPSA